MSSVYLANDMRLNRNWAVKEVKKKGNGIKDEIVINSLMAEANLVKSLDHPALPRIVDIIDREETIYIVMDFIEGESLDKILLENGPPPEEEVINWACQVCDVLDYLHSRKPPIIYRDLKPANLMLKPNGVICIIDFGIAREYKEMSASDTNILGTKGYAPPEQYSGQTDERSDIYALGMTMHHLLTGIDPRKGEPYVPVRQIDPGLSEGIEAIINKCTEPAAENRYQNCRDLKRDLENPHRVTGTWRKSLKRKLICFAVTLSLGVVSLALGIIFNIKGFQMNEQDYDLKIKGNDPESFYEAMEIYPERAEAYTGLAGLYRDGDTDNNSLMRLRSAALENSGQISSSGVGEVFYDLGKLIFSEYEGNLKNRASVSKALFQKAAEEDFQHKDMADCYLKICSFLTEQSTTSEHSRKDYTDILDSLRECMETMESEESKEANYDCITLYYVTSLIINDQAAYMAGLGVEKNEVTTLLEQVYDHADRITSSLTYVNRLQEKMRRDRPDFTETLNRRYSDAERKRRGGDIW